MEGRMVQRESLSGPLFLVAFLTLIASIVPEILSNEILGEVPGWLPYVKIAILMGGGLTLFLWKKRGDLYRYAIVLTIVIGMQIVTTSVGNTSWWRSIFDRNTFAGSFGGNILLKFIGILPVLLLLTMFTATGFRREENLGRLLSVLPLVLLFALANSFCEGAVYRSAVVATLSRLLPKNQLVLVGALFLGIGHYDGIPSGPLGALMGSVLGWYMLRSMYETKGFLSSWIIHFMQDAVIFSTILLMNGR